MQHASYAFLFLSSLSSFDSFPLYTSTSTYDSYMVFYLFFVSFLGTNVMTFMTSPRYDTPLLRCGCLRTGRL
ncbi:hypothetical protein BJ165DRAFT_997302 [Panaeolus papilionaceus]|nr:hypothetical protein BJ165DRAFT_997302 [Panaeolus papilionaceus]